MQTENLHGISLYQINGQRHEEVYNLHPYRIEDPGGMAFSVRRDCQINDPRADLQNIPIGFEPDLHPLFRLFQKPESRFEYGIHAFTEIFNGKV